MSKVTTNILGPINVKSYKQCTNNGYNQYITYKCQKLQTIY